MYIRRIRSEHCCPPPHSPSYQWSYLPLTRVLVIIVPSLIVVVLDVHEGGPIYAWKESIKSTGKEI